VIERWVRVVAGSFIVVSVALSYLVSPYWLLFTLFVGLNLIQSAFTGVCPMESLLRSLGVGGTHNERLADT
jgi:Inner membrane protein YgaP-like, transmembrane domain